MGASRPLVVVSWTPGRNFSGHVVNGGFHTHFTAQPPTTVESALQQLVEAVTEGAVLDLDLALCGT